MKFQELLEELLDEARPGGFDKQKKKHDKRSRESAFKGDKGRKEKNRKDKREKKDNKELTYLNPMEEGSKITKQKHFNKKIKGKAERGHREKKQDRYKKYKKDWRNPDEIKDYMTGKKTDDQF